MSNTNIPLFLEKAFENGFTITEDGNDRYDFYVSEVGEINITDGKIIACDPMLCQDDAEPFTTDFPSGHSPIQLAVAKINDDERVGFSRIKFSAESPVRWEMAAYNDQPVQDLAPDEIIGYPVDSGTGSYMNSIGVKELANFMSEEEDNFEIVLEELNKTYIHTWNWMMWSKSTNNVAMFSSGWGDGVYASYIGYDSNDNICRLVTDFGVI